MVKGAVLRRCWIELEWYQNLELDTEELHWQCQFWSQLRRAAFSQEICAQDRYGAKAQSGRGAFCRV